MSKKLITFLLSVLLVFSMALGLTGCSSIKEESSQKPSITQVDQAPPTDNAKNDTSKSLDSAESTASKAFTLEELATYDGKNGNPAYAAVDGIVYDVTNDRAWREGEHEAYKAGTDLTRDMANAPHGRRVLDGLPVVGKLVK